MVSTSVPRLVPKPRLKHAKGTSRRAQYSASTKRALLDVAQDLFTEHGYAGTSLDAIVAGARVTKGALYHHFAGKQALFEEVFERVEHAASKAVHDKIKGEQMQMCAGMALMTVYPPRLVAVRTPNGNWEVVN